jgi:hypothetical protein
VNRKMLRVFVIPLELDLPGHTYSVSQRIYIANFDSASKDRTSRDFALASACNLEYLATELHIS